MFKTGGTVTTKPPVKVTPVIITPLITGGRAIFLS